MLVNTEHGEAEEEEEEEEEEGNPYETRFKSVSARILQYILT